MSQTDVIDAFAYVVHHWQTIGLYSAGGLTISVLLQWFKKKLHLDKAEVRLLKLIRLDGPRIVVIFLTIFTGIGTGVDWLINPTNAKYIPEHFAWLLVAAFYVHRFIVSPVGVSIGRFMLPYMRALQQVKDQEMAAAAAAAADMVAKQQATAAAPVTTLSPQLNPAPVQPGQIVPPAGA